MNENIAKAMQCAGLLVQDLREINKSAVNKNDALYLLSVRLIEDAARIQITLAQLEKV